MDMREISLFRRKTKQSQAVQAKEKWFHFAFVFACPFRPTTGLLLLNVEMPKITFTMIKFQIEIRAFRIVFCLYISKQIMWLDWKFREIKNVEKQIRFGAGNIEEWIV